MDGTAGRALRCLRNKSLRNSMVRKILGIVLFAISLIGGPTAVLAQSSRDLTEPTATEANRRRTETGGGYYGRAHRAYASAPRLHRRWHCSHPPWVFVEARSPPAYFNVTPRGA